MGSDIIPQISVIIPVYNAELYIKESIDSILNQTFTNFELIIVNDASKDDSKKIIASYTDNRIIFIDNLENKGAANSRNIAIKQAKGKYLAIMDSDDISLPNRLEVQYNYLESHNDVLVVGSFYKIINQSFVSDNLPVSANEVSLFSLLYSPIANPSAFIRKEVLLRHNLKYNSKYEPAEDFDLWTRILDYGDIVNITEVLLNYRIHDNQISTVNEIKKEKAVEEIRKKQLEKLINFSDKNYDVKFVIDTLICISKDRSLKGLLKVENVLNDLWQYNLTLKKYDKLLLRKKLNTIWTWHYCNLIEFNFKTINLITDKCNYKQFTKKEKLKLIIKSILSWKP